MKPAAASNHDPSNRRWWVADWWSSVERCTTADDLTAARRRASRTALKGISTSPGSISAQLPGTRQPLDVTLAITQLDERAWARLYATIEQPAVLAELADRRLPEAWRSSELPRIVPSPADFAFDCSCPAFNQPCPHVLSLACTVGERLAREPHLLLVARGGDVETLLAGPPGTTHDPGPVTGRTGRRRVPASQALRRRLVPLGDEGRSQPVVGAERWLRPSMEPPLDSGVSVAALEMLALDAASRAAELLRGTGATDVEVGLTADAARRLALSDDADVAERLGWSRSRVKQLVDAYRRAGRDGVAVIDDPAPPEANDLAAVTAAVQGWITRSESTSRSAGGDVAARSTGVNIGDGRQLRRAPSGRWVCVEQDDELGWRVVTTGADPAEILAAL